MDRQQLQSQLAGFLKANAMQKFTAQNLADGLRMTDEQGYKQVVAALTQLADDGQLTAVDGHFQHAADANEVTGLFRANDRGFGFVKYDETKPDMFIGPDNTRQAMQGDQVTVAVVKPASGPDRGPEAKVLAITERAFQDVVGVFSAGSLAEGIIGELRISDKKALSYKVLVQASAGPFPTDGQVIAAKITTFPSPAHPRELRAVVTQVIGYKDEPGMDILQIVHAKKIPSDFPEEVLAQAATIPSEVQPDEWAGREDLTDQPLITIDSADTKDIDDAVVAWKLPNGNFHLGVHIADVSHYVPEGSDLDQEAYNRGTSVYLTDRVIPMLPRNISNGIASLNPNVDRLAMSAEMEITPQGNVIKHHLHTSVIRSRAKMSYVNVNAILAGDSDLRDQYQELVPMLETMAELHDVLVAKRSRRGAIEFDAAEAKIIVDESGRAIDIELRDRGVSERMIESFMLAANETVAEHFQTAKVPFLYRVHETPDSERAQSFFEFAKTLGHPITGDPNQLTPKMFQGLMVEMAGQPEAQMISTMMLRAMKQAKYGPDPIGHFGLGAEYYTHFTSPIRRYPDLTVHRLIKWYQQRGFSVQAQERYASHLNQIGLDTSTRERRAIDAEREVDALKKAEYMADKVGMEFDGVVNSALKFGLFVSLENTVEGLVHISNLTDDYYEYDDKHAALIGRSSHRIFTIGQPVRIKVLRVNPEERTVDFMLVNPTEAPTTEWRVASRPQRPKKGGSKRTNGDRSKSKK